MKAKKKKKTEENRNTQAFRNQPHLYSAHRTRPTPRNAIIPEKETSEIKFSSRR
jgi:hypothetical protein